MSTIHHVVLDDRGIAWIDETNTKVIEVAADHLAHGTSPAEMHLQYPNLSIAQIHAALAYYYDHQADFDRQLAEQLREYEQLRASAAESPGKARLRQQGLI